MIIALSAIGLFDQQRAKGARAATNTCGISGQSMLLEIKTGTRNGVPVGLPARFTGTDQAGGFAMDLDGREIAQ